MAFPRSMTGLLFIFWLFSSTSHASNAWRSPLGDAGLRGGVVRTAVEFQGAVYVLGTFEGFGCTASAGIARLTDDGLAPGPEIWRTPSAIEGHGITTAVAFGDALVLAGDIRRSIFGQHANHLIAWDGQALASIGALVPLPGETATIHDLAVFEGDLIAVGEFAGIGTVTGMDGVARFDGSTWSPMGSRPTGAEALAVFQGSLFCGLARWNGTAWEDLGTIHRSSRVTALDVVDEGLAIGGTFFRVDGDDSMRGAVLFDGETLSTFGDGVTTAYDPGFDECPCPAGVAGFASYEGVTYVLAEQYRQYQGSFGLARLEAGTGGGVDRWERVDTVDFPKNYAVGRDGRLDTGALEVVDGRLLVISGSAATTIDTDSADALGVVCFDGTQWGGIAGLERSRRPPIAIGRVAGSTWTVHPTDGLLEWTPEGFERHAPEVTVRDLVGRDDRLLVSGEIVHQGHVPAIFPELRSISPDGDAITTCRTSFEAENILFSGFDEVLPWRGGWIVQLIDRSYETIGPAGPVWIDSDCGYQGMGASGGAADVSAMTLHDDVPWIAAGGELYRVLGDPTSGLELELVATFGAEIRALASDGSRLFVGGAFQSVNGTAVAHLAAFDGTTFVQPIALSAPVTALAGSDDGRIAVGTSRFVRVEGQVTRGLFEIRPNEILLFPQGPDGTVHHLVRTPQGLLAAGDFDRVGGLCTGPIAEWIDPELDEVSVADSAPDSPPSGLRTELRSPRPNPFNPRVTIDFELARAAHVRVEIVDARGRQVRTLTAAHHEAGRHEVLWSGQDAAGRPVASGVYFARMFVDGRSWERKMALIR